MFIVALLIITKNWKQPQCPLMSEWLNKLCYIHTIYYYSAIKRNELLIYITWMNLQRIMPSKKSQSQKVTYCVIPFL